MCCSSVVPSTYTILKLYRVRNTWTANADAAKDICEFLANFTRRCQQDVQYHVTLSVHYSLRVDEEKELDRQCTRYTEARSRNHCCCGKAISITYWPVCACMRVRACVRACGRPSAWACAWAYVHTALLIQHAKSMRHILASFVAPRFPLNFSTLSHKRCDFREKLLNIKCVFLFSLQLLSKTFLILRRIQRNIVKNVETSSCKLPVIFVGF